MPWLNLNERKFSFEEILTVAGSKGLSAFERATLSFCGAWLSGRAKFTIQTSGSTGTPKTITLHRSQMEASARQTIKALTLQEEETALVCLDTRYIAGQMMLVRSLLSGMNIIAVEPAANPFKNIEGQQIDFAALVPYQLDTILIETSGQFDKVRCAIIGGAMVTNSLKEKLMPCPCKVFASYGMTETISHIALQRLNGPNAQTHFEAFSDVDLRRDERGCLCIKTAYLEQEIVTNDLVELFENGKFRWLGRIDNVINSGGVKIIPEKVESVFEKVFDKYQIKNHFFVAGLPHEQLGQEVTLVIEGAPLEESVHEKIIVEARKHLSKYEQPKAVLSIPSFEQTATGKINRPLTLALL
jgi:o-succinylbenzoate---CoA ligase